MMRWRWHDDEMMMTWWCHDDDMMMTWWWHDDDMMMTWWWHDDAMMMTWWWHDDDMMMTWWWHDDDMMMTWWWHDDDMMMTWWWHDDDMMMTWWWHDDDMMMTWWWHDDDMMMTWWWHDDDMMMTWCASTGRRLGLHQANLVFVFHSTLHQYATKILQPILKLPPDVSITVTGRRNRWRLISKCHRAHPLTPDGANTVTGGWTYSGYTTPPVGHSGNITPPVGHYCYQVAQLSTAPVESFHLITVSVAGPLRPLSE